MARARPVSNAEHLRHRENRSAPWLPGAQWVPAPVLALLGVVGAIGAPSATPSDGDGGGWRTPSRRS